MMMRLIGTIEVLDLGSREAYVHRSFRQTEMRSTRLRVTRLRRRS